MRPSQTLDSLVRERLKQWPQRPPGVKAAALGKDSWLRGRPSEDLRNHPFLKLPGSNALAHLAGRSVAELRRHACGCLCGIFAIEACGSLQNLLDKRSRFAPSTHSLLAVCPVQWLLSPVMPGDSTPRWKIPASCARNRRCRLRRAGTRHARALRPQAEALSGLRTPPIAACARVPRTYGGVDRV